MRVKRVTLAQKKFIKEYLRTGSPGKAASFAYPQQTKKTQQTSAYRNLNHSVVVRKYLQELLDREGLSDEKIANRLRLIVDAGTTKKALRQATPKDAFQSLKFAAELKDMLPAKRIEQKTASLNVNLEGKSEGELQETLNSLISEMQDFKKMTLKAKEIREQRIQDAQQVQDAETAEEEDGDEEYDSETKKNIEALQVDNI